VFLCEREPKLMQRASYANQARVHNDYHYPRSVLTAVRSRVNFPRFAEEFRSAIVSAFDSLYAVARRSSKVSADQFYRSMRRIGAPIRPAPARLGALFDRSYVEAAFLTQEYVFNTATLCEITRVHQAGVRIQLHTSVRGLGHDAVKLVVETEGPEGAGTRLADHVFCCGYAHLNAPAAGQRVTLGAAQARADRIGLGGGTG
jgi:hypothetical protein